MKPHNTKITHRDLDVFEILKRLPLTTTQLFRVSQTFSLPFPCERIVYRRMQKLAAGGFARRFYYAFPSEGRNPVYWRLTNKSLRLVSNGSEQNLKQRRAVSKIGVSLHFHTHQLSEFLVCLLLSAKKASVEVPELSVEHAIKLGPDGDVVIPDATFAFAAPNGNTFRFHVELDTGTERVSTLQRIPSSIQKKLEFYERLRMQSSEPFRVLFITTSSEIRANNILKFSDKVSSNPTSRLVYAAFLPELLLQDNCVTDQIFNDHKLRPVRLMRRPSQWHVRPESSGIYGKLVNQQYQLQFKWNVDETPAKC